MPTAITNFDEMASIIRANAAGKISKSERIRTERWIEKLEENDCLNSVWQKDRMEYMKLLMYQVMTTKHLSTPYHSTPPDGMLPRFPTHVLTTLLKTKTSTLVDPEKVKFWREINTKIKTPRRTINATTTATATATTTVAQKVQQLEAEIRNEKIQQCHQLHQLAAVHSHELSKAAVEKIRSNSQQNSAINHPFFGSAVSFSSSSSHTTTVGQSAAAALIAATGIDAVLASIQDLETETEMDSTMSRPISIQHGDITHAHPPPSQYPLHDSNNLSTNLLLSINEPPITSTLHITSDEEFLVYLKKFQTELECL